MQNSSAVLLRRFAFFNYWLLFALILFITRSDMKGTTILFLIAAAAGFGKTTVLSEWIPQSPRCVTWLSLDETDTLEAQAS